MKTRTWRFSSALQFVHVSRSSSCLATGLSPRPGSFGTTAGVLLLHRRRLGVFVLDVEQARRVVMTVIGRKMMYKN